MTSAPRQQPAPLCELDELRNRFMGLRVVQDDEPEDLVSTVRVSTLPQYSSTACHLHGGPMERLQPKRIKYSLNNQGCIVWISYG